jgi:MmyB-like transcription regulator ligand binding domain
VPGPFDRTAPECRDVAVVVEELLARRRGEAAQPRPPWRGCAPRRWGPKRWTREELCDDAYSSYKALLKGSIRRPPRRAVVLAIADYLKCTLAERNLLLVAAQYAPQQPYLTGVALTAALALAQETVDYVPLPAYVVTREWDGRSTNAHLLTLFGATRAQVDAIPPEQRNILHLVFAPSLPLYKHSSGTREAWKRTARIHEQYMKEAIRER